MSRPEVMRKTQRSTSNTVGEQNPALMGTTFLCSKLIQAGLTGFSAIGQGLIESLRTALWTG